MTVATASATEHPHPNDDLYSGTWKPAKLVPLRHPWRWVAVAVELVLLAMLFHAIFTQPAFQWSVVGKYLFDSSILKGVVVTIELTAVAMVAAIVLGIGLALMRLSENPVLRVSSLLYITFFRGTPALVQILFWFNLAALFPRLGIGIPFGPEFVSGSANSFVTPFLAAILGLGLQEAAFMAEIIRGGVLGVDSGQTEAIKALGISRAQGLRKVILPQAMRIIVPPTGNEVIGMLKYTSLASVIAASELLQSAQTIYTRTFQIIPLLIVASIWYVFMTTVLTMLQRVVERRFSRGATRSSATTPKQRGLMDQIGRNLVLGRARRAADVRS